MGTTLQALKMRGQYCFFALLITLFAFTNVSLADNTTADFTPPDVLLKQATHDIFDALNQHRQEIKTHPDKLKSLVEKIILPHLDLITASKWVMGKYWRRADKAQKIKFIKSFRTLLLRFYSSALSEYLNNNDKVLDEKIFSYLPIRGKLEDKDVTVRVVIKQENGEKIPINYGMHLTRKGWKIYDVSVEGVSMITTYKNNFATELKQKGVDGLIASINEKNKQLLIKNGN